MYRGLKALGDFMRNRLFTMLFALLLGCAYILAALTTPVIWWGFPPLLTGSWWFFITDYKQYRRRERSERVLVDLELSNLETLRGTIVPGREAIQVQDKNNGNATVRIAYADILCCSVESVNYPAVDCLLYTTPVYKGATVSISALQGFRHLQTLNVAPSCTHVSISIFEYPHLKDRLERANIRVTGNGVLAAEKEVKLLKG